MERDILTMIVDLEHDLAASYEQLNRLVRIRQENRPFDLLVLQSKGHAEAIETERDRNVKPRLDETAITTLHQRLKESVFREVIAEPDIARAHDRLADAERTLGRLYESIGTHCARMRDYYAALGSKIEAIAGEEYAHEALLRREARRLRDARVLAAVKTEPAKAEPAKAAPAPPNTDPAKGSDAAG